MTDKLEAFLNAAKQNKQLLNQFRTLAVYAGQLELGAQLRDLEVELFPDTPEQSQAKQEGERISGVLSMSGIDTNAKSSWICVKTIDAFNEKGGEFSIEDGAVIRADADRLFGL